MTNPQLTADVLRRLLDYDPETGIFIRIAYKCRRSRTYDDHGAGTTAVNGYRVIGVAGARLYAHRLAWLFVYGHWPPHQIDHIDGDRSNNAIKNLRLATNAQNARNSRARRADGLKGIYFHKLSGLWAATIMTDGVKRSLGYHQTPELAHAAYARAAQCHHGSFARTK